MKRNYLLIAAGLLCAVTMQAQKRVVASLGFEDSDAKYTTPYSLTALDERPSWWGEDNANVNGSDVGFIHGDWVNYKFGDEWNEKSQKAPHSGDYCFQAINHGSKLNSWDRGFKIGLEGVQEETPYRVSFWAKIDPEDENGDPTVLTSWFSQGTEELDKSIPNYGIDQSKELISGQTLTYTGEWQHFVYQVFVCKKDVIDATHASWQGTNIFPPAYGGDGETYWDHFGQHFPDLYFFIANMFSPSTYYLDDILVEENVTVKEVSYSSEIIKVDFGYANNIGNLAKANAGTISLKESCVTVTQDGEPVEVAYVEGKSDGFLYIFVNEELYEDSEVIVNFTGDDRLLYTSAQRPSADTTGDVAVFGFEDEKAYWDEEVYAEALAYGVPSVKRSVPANGSFNLLAEEVTELSMTFTSKIDISKAKGNLKNSKAKKDVTSLMSLSADGLTISVPVTADDLADGVNVFAVEGLQNETGTEKNISAEISFEIGEVQGDGSLLVVYKSDFENYDASSLPVGYSGTSDGSDRQSTSASPLTGQSGAPRMMGTADNPNHGIYWGARGGSQGILSLGKYAALAAAENGGTLPEDYTSADALWFDEGTYYIDYKNASWDGASGNAYKVGIYDADGFEIFVEEGITPGITIAQGPGEGTIPVSSYEFTVETPGYYYVEFEGNTGWSCWLMTSLEISSKPESASAYWMKQLNDEIKTATTLLENTDEKYAGAATEALGATIEEAQNGRYTNADEVQAIVKKLQAAEQAVSTRKSNYDNFVKKYADAQEQIATLEGKYARNEKVKDAEAILAKYEGVNPTELSDDDLAAASKDVDNVPGILSNIKTVIDYLTARAMMAADLANNLFVDEEIVDRLKDLSTDNTALINDVNKITTQALCEFIADDAYASLWTEAQYSDQVNEDFDETIEEQRETHDDEGHPLKYVGIDMTSYVKNPNFYTTALDASVANFPGWTLEGLTYSRPDENGELVEVEQPGSAKMTAAATETNPVVLASLNGYGSNAEYKFYQTVENLPAGVYIIYMQTRTAQKNNADPETGKKGCFNAKAGDVWDKYIFAQVDDEPVIAKPFAVGAYNTNGYPTSIYKVTVKEGQKLTFGAVEQYLSGEASGHDWDADLGAYVPANYWDTNTWVRDAKLFFYAPLEDYDYAAAALRMKQDIETAIEGVENAPAKQAGARYNLAGQKVDANYKGIVISANGKKFIQ